MGLDAASVGSGSLQRIIRLRMKGIGISDAGAYQQHLSDSRAEWEQLVEAVVITETWFFRDPEAFEVVVAQSRVRDHALALNVLTVPCSSGEEPYSLAIALMNAGVSRERFRIDAVDISAHALARAKRAVYTRNSFRGGDLAFRDRYFQKTKDGFVLHPEVCNCVKFIEGNLLNSTFSIHPPTYDFIFCRNLLIYFDRPTQERALKKLDALLAPAGILFVGPAEQPLALEHGFVSANYSRAFACRKAPSQKSPVRHCDEPVAGWNMPSALPVSFPAPVSAANPDTLFSIEQRTAKKHQMSQVSDELDTARQLADAGRLVDAAAICVRYLSIDTDSAQGWYLLGLIRDAAGDMTAVDCYRKALYLKPDHYETLIQMALWWQKNGNFARARTFKARAERVKSVGLNSKEASKARYA